MGVQKGKWYCRRGEDGQLLEEFARLVTGQDWTNGGRAATVLFLRRWPGRNNSFTTAESSCLSWEWRGFESGAEVMPDDWKPAWFGTIPDGPSIERARKAGRII
jgi:hypothetical protein